MLSQETLDLVNLTSNVPQFDVAHVDVDDDGLQFVVTVRNTNGHYAVRNTRDWAEATPGSKECNIPGVVGNHYYMPVGFLTVLRLQKAFAGRITWLSPLAEATANSVLAQFAAGIQRAKINADWTEHKKVPQHNLSIKEGVELSPYQQVAAHMASIGDSFLFAMEQGTGKTPTAIATMCTWLEQATEFQRIVVVCPRNVVYNWITELKAFSSVPVKVEAIRGGEIRRIGKLAKVMKPEEGFKAGIAVINYDGIMAMAEIFAAFDWDIIITDESHYIKAPTSQRTKYFVNRLRDKCKKRLELTGTPIANTAMDLWSQFEFLGTATSGFATYKGYRDFYARMRKNQETGFEQMVGLQHVPVLQEVLARNAFIIRASDAMPWLPEKLYTVEEVEMSPKQREMYKQIATQLAIEIEEDLETQTENRQLLISNILTKLLRLAQVTSAFIKWDPILGPDGEVLRPAIIEDLPENPKIDWCVECIKNRPKNEKTLFWSWMTHDIKALAARLDEEGIEYVTYTGSTSDADRIEAERRFNTEPSCTVFIGNPAAGGTGLNLIGHDPKNPDDYDTDATLTVYIAQNWNAVHRSQSEARGHRRGTRKPHTVTTLVCAETIDEDIHERVTMKRKVALEISDIRHLLSKLIGDLS